MQSEKTKFFIKKAKNIHGDLFDYSKVDYITNKTKIIIICKKHGDFEQTPNRHLTGDKCPACSGQKRLTTEEFIKKAIEVHGTLFDYSKTIYKSLKTKVIIICKKHGEFIQAPDNHIYAKAGCPECSPSFSHTLGKIKDGEIRQKRVLDTNQFIKDAQKIHGDTYDYSKTKYTKGHETVIIICKEHGEFNQIANSHIRQKSGCAKCAGNVISNKEEFITKSIETHGDKYDYSKVNYINNKTDVIIICKNKKHGQFKQNPWGHIKGFGCPKCGIRSSGLEVTLSNFFKEKFPSLKVIEGDRKVLAKCGEANKPLELDFYIPEYNIAIELHGNRWHSEAVMEYHKARIHIFEKYKLCKERGIQLLQFYEDEVLFKEEIVKSIISYKLGLVPDKTYARKLKVVEVDKEIAKEFLNDNHLQGQCSFKLAYGLVDKNEENLYAVMAFSYTVSNRGSKADPDKWELVRFASHGSVIGGASKLLHHFIKEHPECDEIISYSDNRISDGGLYDKLGFEVDDSVKITPDYYYIKPNDKTRTRYSKSSLQKSKQQKLFTVENGYIPYNPNETEYVNANRNGYYRIWNAGLVKWILK